MRLEARLCIGPEWRQEGDTRDQDPRVVLSEFVTFLRPALSWGNCFGTCCGQHLSLSPKQDVPSRTQKPPPASAPSFPGKGHSPSQTSLKPLLLFLLLPLFPPPVTALWARAA